jgi:hypothetical protein
MFSKEYTKHVNRTNPEQRIGIAHELIVRDDLSKKGVMNYSLTVHPETIEIKYGNTKQFYIFNGLRIIDIITDKQ